MVHRPAVAGISGKSATNHRFVRTAASIGSISEHLSAKSVRSSASSLCYCSVPIFGRGVCYYIRVPDFLTVARIDGGVDLIEIVTGSSLAATASNSEVVADGRSTVELN